tara:strand:+ start:282 stop:422 length:141 start_codon:yes stop_codon:yes gene_type:complete
VLGEQGVFLDPVIQPARNDDSNHTQTRIAEKKDPYADKLPMESSEK